MTFKKNLLLLSCITVMIGIGLTIAISKPEPILHKISGSIVSMSEQELILDSELIITGEVLKYEESKWSNPGNKIPDKTNRLQTDVIFKINEVVSGTYNNDTVVIRIDRGYDKKTNTIVLNDMYPEFELGEKLMLFLRRDGSDLATDEDYFVLTGLKQGAFDLKDDGIVESYKKDYTIKTIPQLKQRIAVEKQNNPDWKEKKVAETERTRIENTKLFGE